MASRTKLATLAAALAALSAPPAGAHGLSMERFVEWCGDPSSAIWREVGQQVCPSYISGLIDGARLQAQHTVGPDRDHREAMRFCITEGVGAQEAIDAVLAYVGTNPESRRAPAAATVYVALAAAWPCPR